MAHPTRQVLSTSTVFRGQFIQISVDRVRTPGGRTVSMEIVRHPGSVVIIAMPDPSHVWLVRQFRHAVDRSLWELPAGRIDAGETPEVAAERECIEETGWHPSRIERVGELFATPGYCDERMVFFLATASASGSPVGVLSDAQVRLNPDEGLEARLFSLDDARAAVADGEPGDLKTAFGLQLIGRR